MKKAKGKKKRINRKKGGQSVNKHIRHERIGNFLYYGEEIVKELIDKIISLSITMHNTNRIYSKLGDICFDHFKKEVTYYLKQEFIVHERDELIFPEFQFQTDLLLKSCENIEPIQKISNDQENNTLFSPFADIIPDEIIKPKYDFKFAKSNFWGFISQPSSTIKDREASTQIDFLKYYPLPPNKKDNENNGSKKKDINKALLDSSNKMQYKKKLSSSSLNLYYSYNTNTNNTINNQKESTPHKKTLIANLPYFDIPHEKLQLINELPEIKDLRLEKEKQIKQKEEEIKKQSKIVHNEIEINRNYLSSKHNDKKLFTKFTTDSQGGIISIKPIPLDKLVMEFSVAKYQQKEVQHLSNSLFNKQKSFSLPQKQTDNSDIKPEVIKNLNVPDNSSFKADKTSPQLTKLTLSDTIHTISNANSIMRQVNLGISRSLAYKFNNKRQISPCGSAFDLMKPEIGVTILEDSKVKSGGKDFFKKYNRLSVENYKQTLKETFLNRTTSTFEFFPKKNNNNLNNDFHTPLHTNRPIELKLNKPNINKDNFSVQGPSLKKVNSAANIRMANHKFSSICSAMDNLDLLNEQNKVISTKNKKTEIFTIQNIYENMKKTILEKKPWSPVAMHSNRLSHNNSTEFNEINKFNKTLINCKQWGKFSNLREKFMNSPTNHIRSPTKVSQKEINLYTSKIKMPRERIKQSAQEVLMNNTMKYFKRKKLLQTKGLNFYKQNNIKEPVNKVNNN